MASFLGTKAAEPGLCRPRVPSHMLPIPEQSVEEKKKKFVANVTIPVYSLDLFSRLVPTLAPGSSTLDLSTPGISRCPTPSNCIVGAEQRQTELFKIHLCLRQM